MLYGASHQVEILANDLRAGNRQAADTARVRASATGVAGPARRGQGHRAGGRLARLAAGLNIGVAHRARRPLGRAAR